MIRLKPQSGAIRRDGFVEFVLPVQYDAKIAMGIGIIGTQNQRPAKLRLGFIKPADFHQRVAEIIVRLGEIPIEFDRPAMGGNCIVDPANPGENQTPIVVEVRARRSPARLRDRSTPVQPGRPPAGR